MKDIFLLFLHFVVTIARLLRPGGAGLVHELRTMLERGQIDAVLGPQSLAEPNDALRFEHLIDDRVGVLCRAGHKLATLNGVMPSDLESQAWLAHSRGMFSHQGLRKIKLLSYAIK